MLSNIKGIYMKNKKPIFLIIVFLFISLVVFSAFKFLNSKKDNPSLSKAVVFRKDLSLTTQATGIVKPMIGAEVKVGSRISGKVEHLYANVGEEVKKGDIIAELEQDELMAEIEDYEAQLNEAVTNLDKALSQFEFDKRELVRKNELYLKKFLSLQDIYKAKTCVEQSDNDIKSLKAHIGSVRARLKSRRINYSYSVIKAPISGVIASISTQEGETVSAGLNAPTFVTIIDLSKLQIDANVDETDIGRIKIGQKVYFSVDTYPDKDFDGVVEAIHPKAIIQDNVVYYDVVIKITSPEKNLLRPEMTASVNIFIEDKKNVLAISNLAIKREGDKKVCYLLKDGQVEKKEIKTGIKDSQYTEIIKGLKEGNIVILENNTLQSK